VHSNDTFARRLRNRRLYHHGDGLLVVPMDHAVTDGPFAADLNRLVGAVAGNGADAVVLHKGSVRRVDPRSFARTSLVVHLSAGTATAPDPHARCLVAGVEEALRLGADAVSVHVNVGARQQQQQLADLGAVAERCERWGLPLLAMMYPVGPGVGAGRSASGGQAGQSGTVRDPHDPERIAHAAAIAAELGADLVKTPYPGSVAALQQVTRDCPIPVLVAGGAARPNQSDLLAWARDVMRAGAGGVAVGRNIFHHADPGAITRRLAAHVHERAISQTGVAA
jgi:2-amino-4,5-dihydroxy-6-oxo-7-(phosphonooxy)heptanoate synthase